MSIELVRGESAEASRRDNKTTMPFPISGNIQDSPLPDVLEALHQKKATGTLTVRCDENIEKAICLKDGQIVFASSTDGHDRLGEMLVRAGKLSMENLETALRTYSKNAGFKKLGAILVESRFVAPKDLFVGLKTQVKDIIYSLFLIDSGEYRFTEHLPADIIQLQLNMQELIAEIIQRIKQEA